MSLANISDYTSALLTHCSTGATALPAVLVAAGVADFSEYIDYYMEDPEKLIFGVYPVTINQLVDYVTITYILHAQLPGVVADVPKYIKVLDTFIRAIKPKVIGFTNLEVEGVFSYPGNWGGGEGGAFIMYQLDFKKELNSCN